MLLNKTRKNVISSKIVLADSVFKKFRGLMFEKWNNFNYALVFPFEKASRHRAAIHMFFVFFPIDAVYLRGGKVVDCIENAAPFTPFIAPKSDADMLIELPAGVIGKKKIAVGDIVAIEWKRACAKNSKGFEHVPDNGFKGS